MPALRSGQRGRRRLRVLVAGCAGLAAGALFATVFAMVGLAGDAVGNANDRPNVDPARLIDAAHLPPLLTRPAEVAALRYDVYCPPPDGAPDEGPCDAGGTVWARPGDAGPFTAIPLALDRQAGEGRLVARLPRRIAGSPSGFSYYAILRNRATGASLTLPAGGAAAPQRSFPLGGAVDVDLGAHAFGVGRRAGERAFSARWGSGAAEVGLEGGPEVQPVGPSAFDVDRHGRVTVLDQVNRRALRVAPGMEPKVLPLAVNGTIADLAVADDGTLWVLETAGPRAPLVRAFDAGGRQLEAAPLAERTASQLRLGPDGPVVKQYPSEAWLPAAEGSDALTRRAQTAAAEPVQPLEDGRRVAVLRVADELRVALVGRPGVTRSWRIRSATPLAEVQLAEPVGERMVVVVRVYTEAHDEFLVLVLGERGLVSRFAVPSADWAETAPLSRFRLAGSSLYQLGSTPRGVHVDRFDLEVG